MSSSYSEQMESYCDEPRKVGKRHDIKECSRCKEDKSISEFYTNKRNKSGLSSYCKKCQIGYNKKYLSKMRDAKDKEKMYVKKGERNPKEFQDILKNNVRVYLDPNDMGDWTTKKDGTEVKKIKLCFPNHIKVLGISNPKTEYSKIIKEDGSQSKRDQYNVVSITVKHLQ